MINKKRIELEAQKILNKFGIRQAPVPVEDIISKMGIKMGYAPSDEYSGILIRKDKVALMGINSNEPEARRRFSMAHELGHFIFEKNTVTIDHRNNNYLEKPEKEKCADLFAANLLMPGRMLRIDYERSIGATEEKLLALARKYKVSMEAMRIRLASLGLAEWGSYF